MRSGGRRGSGLARGAFLALALFPAGLAGQEAAPYNADDVLSLLEGGVAVQRIIALIAGSCVLSGASPGVQQRLEGAGASPELLRTAAVFTCPALPATIELQGVPTELVVGQSRQVAARVLDGTGEILGDSVVTWRSSNEGVVRVLAQGLLEAVGAGSAQIGARSGTVEEVFELHVRGEVSDIRTDADELTLEVGEFARLSATAVDASGRTLPDTIAWSGGGEGVVEVADDGSVWAQAPGTAEVTATVAGVQRVVVVRVTPRQASALAVVPRRLLLEVGEEGVLDIRVAPETAAGEVVLLSDDSSVVQVEDGGRVRGRAGGLARIVARADGVEASAEVRVLAARRSVGGALATGLVLPGGGQFVAGRASRGLLTLLAVGGATAWAIVPTRTEVCSARVASGERCPPHRVVDEREERPRLATGAAIAGAVWLLSAIDAAVGASRHNRAVDEVRRDPWADGPSVAPGPNGSLEVRWQIPIGQGGG